MIPEYFIQEWHENAPWQDPAMVEQDLIICRALASIFSDEFLASQLAFRGGTALHKLHLQHEIARTLTLYRSIQAQSSLFYSDLERCSTGCPIE